MSEGFRNPVAKNTGELILSNIHSPNYVAGSTGWTINKDGSSEFSNGQFRGAVVVGTPPNPHLEITTTIPASLIALTVPAIYTTIYAGTFYYFSSTDYYFDIVALSSFGTPVLARGEVVSIAGVPTFYKFEEYSGAAAPSPALVNYGSNGTAGGHVWQYTNGELTMLSNARLTQHNIGSIGTQGIRSTDPIMTGYSTASVSSAGVETAFTIPNWTQYPTGDFQTGHTFKVTVDCYVSTNVNGVGQQGTLRVRQGTATIVGTKLAEWFTDPLSGSAAHRHYEAYFQNPVATKLGQDLSLSWIRTTAANTLAVSGNPLILNVYDLGLTSECHVPTGAQLAMT